MAAGKLEVGVLAGLAALTAEKAGARLLTSAAELKILSPSGTFATTRGFDPTQARRRRTANALFRRSDSLSKNQSSGSIALLQKYFGGLSAEEASYLYQEQIDLLETLPAPNEKALQAVLDRETDPKGRTYPVRNTWTRAFFVRLKRVV